MASQSIIHEDIKADHPNITGRTADLVKHLCQIQKVLEKTESEYIKSLTEEQRKHIKYEYADARRKMAILRRINTGSDEDICNAFSVLVPYVSKTQNEEDDILFLAAGLFALYPKHTERVSFGTAMGLLAARTDTGGAEARLLAILGSRKEDLATQLRPIFPLLQSKYDEGLDYKLIIFNLLDWNENGKPVQKQWAKDFYIALHNSKKQSSNNEENLENQTEDTKND